MNLSDLVHRTAGDSQTISTASHITHNNTTSHLFQPTESPNAVSNFTSGRQDPLFFSISSFTQEDASWTTTQPFFPNNQDIRSFVDSVPLMTESTTADNTSKTTNKNPFSPVNVVTIEAPDTLDFINDTNTLNNSNLYSTTNSASYTTQNLFRLYQEHNSLITGSSVDNTTTTNTTTTSNSQVNNIELDQDRIETEEDKGSPSEQPVKSPEKEVIKHRKPIVALTINGDNVTPANIEEGYIQFVLNHDSSYIGDGIESLMYAKRKFSSVPKTGDLSYTTYDIYQLVLKLYRHEIKNWSQLVGQLGLSDMSGRPQFAQRVKRWMHKYKIDCYFDYLLGNAYNFNAKDEKYSGCLMMGNYQKKRPDKRNADENDSSKADNDDFKNEYYNRRRDESQSDDDENDSDEENGRLPVLVAGSRKRMRESSQNSLQVLANYKKPHLNSEGEMDSDDEMKDRLNTNQHGDPSDTEDSEDEAEKSDSTCYSNSPVYNANSSLDESDNNSMDIIRSELVEEEDELASSSPSPIMGILSFKENNSSASSQRENNTYFDTNEQETTITTLKNEVSRLRSYVSTLENRIEEQNKTIEADRAEINQYIREKSKFREKNEKWKKRLIQSILRGPLLYGNNEEEEEDEESSDDSP
ncbi:ARS binding protein 2-domain-containing protein [Pilobolus umbonatus]|nr:ARS binding protein 2-domain-containing protein [Pilobolus umbonatus]